MNQEYRDRVKRHLEAGGDPKYVNVKRKADARHAEFSAAKSKAVKKAKVSKSGIDSSWSQEKKEYYRKMNRGFSANARRNKELDRKEGGEKLRDIVG